MKNKREREAAINLRKIWQSHDERDETAGWIAASELFVLFGAGKEESSKAGFMTIHAYFLADQAKMYQGRNDEMEDFFYSKISHLLRESRRILGMETKSVKHTVTWWKAFRHNDIKSIKNEIYREHLEQFTNLDDKNKINFSKKCTEKLIQAGEGHNMKKWSMTDDLLTDYFKEYFEALSLNKKGK